ncbi:hypothetical protein SAMN05443244_2315 [Terriglobus roseus]|uniref:Uncharacterized protein n=1 Tax=Terriglobus roseus TaxID=392734 RepID=A0A1H4NPF9_9BACT|nr:hypothetical protein SAMN05443244_2315 [Terriglobus roseus]
MGFDWKLQLQRYVIEDGSAEHYVGEVFTWVAEFHCAAVLELSTVRERLAFPVERNRYRVNAEVIYISQDPRHDCCVLDFGITAISETGSLLGVPLPPGCREGDYVAGDVWLESPLCTCI